jgi:hypothetical protein
MHSHSHKHTQFNTFTISGIRMGLTLKDSVLLKKDFDYKPKIQTFIFEDDYNLEPEQREYFCAVDKSLLDYHKYLDIWICHECFQHYDTRIQDTPIKDKSGFKLFAHSEHNPYATLDDNDPNLPFVQGIDPNREPEEHSKDAAVEQSKITEIAILMQSDI